ncbi:flavin-containing monooxygenase [Mesohalobacter halotolerans]|uniref:Potassium transporter Trk n=1 Tax=Mesohalobacter halotolerans TaxID=1883405 RepID=A0A4V6AP07_9FLAO|nr:NAD(P)/FAD-dependent oxidoreductase [Mesohalobacter halotolerans]MBS3738530.1 NAD(P)-binding domain-containing protein [Psychroflexus sp.]TKS56845.1 potassium transporter Trk [Mesohalobacter halotolerans]
MYDFIIVGAAQAGLSMAYELKQMNANYLVLDKEKEIGASWLNRWDSLKLFTPTEFNHLKGLNFPAPKGHYPNKYEVADYFKTYVDTFEIPVQLHTLITKIYKNDGLFVLESENKTFVSHNVVIATGPFHIPYTPPFHKKISSQIKQWHSNYYKNPNQLQDGDCLVVGAGDSGFQILDEVSQTGRETYFSGQTQAKTLPQEILGKTLWWWFCKTGYLSIHKHHWLGKIISKSKQPVIGVDVKGMLNRENVIAVGKTIDAENDIIMTENRSLKNIKNIIWATGYRPNFNWIEDIELDKEGYPVHKRGVSNTKGLYFIGLPWLYTRGSATLGGIKQDADYLAEYISKTSELVLQ